MSRGILSRSRSHSFYMKIQTAFPRTALLNLKRRLKPFSGQKKKKRKRENKKGRRLLYLAI